MEETQLECKWAGTEHFGKMDNGLLKRCKRCNGDENCQSLSTKPTDSPSVSPTENAGRPSQANSWACFGLQWTFSCVKRCQKERACFETFLGMLCERGILKERCVAGIGLVYTQGDGLSIVEKLRGRR